MPPRYHEWLQYLFDQPVTPNGWYFDIDCPSFEANEIELAELIAHTLENCGNDLVGYSDAQVNYGLNYIFNNSCSDVVFSLMRDIATIKHLYRDCFSPRCAHVLGHINESGANPINHIGYMLWDASPLSYWERFQGKEIFYRAVVDVMEEALTLSNPACVESALHGLGHVQPYFPERVIDVVSSYLRRGIFASPQLETYAQMAGRGYVQ